MKTFLIGTAAAAAIFASGSALAQPAPPTPPGVAQGTAPLHGTAPRVVQKRVVMMSDKSMTRDDVVAHVRQLFAHLDTNRDGFLTREEVNAMHGRMMAMHGSDAHAMRDDRMQPRDRAAAFDRLDTNKDGSISRQEFMAAQPRIEERRVIMRKGRAADEMSMQGMGMRMGMHFGGNMFAMADTNRDGRVSMAEAQQLALAHFDRADLNHDGKVTPDERRAAHQRMHGEHRPG